MYHSFSRRDVLATRPAAREVLLLILCHLLIGLNILLGGYHCSFPLSPRSACPQLTPQQYSLTHRYGRTLRRSKPRQSQRDHRVVMRSRLRTHLRPAWVFSDALPQLYLYTGLMLYAWKIHVNLSTGCRLKICHPCRPRTFWRRINPPYVVILITFPPRYHPTRYRQQ